MQKQSDLGKEDAIFNEQVFKKSKTNAYESLHFRASLQRSIEFLHETICYYFPIVITIAAICVFTKDTWTLMTHCMSVGRKLDAGVASVNFKIMLIL